MPFGRKSPLEALALPGVMLAYKYSQFRQRRREAASRRVTERELSALHHKIDKLLSKLEEESEPDPPTSQEDECVICINARATMQTSPCGHRVVCRRCFVKTIQSAVAQRLLPLRCVICRARVNRLTSSSGTWRIQESASSYSMGAKSWSSAGVAAGGVVASASSYSMNDAHSGHHTFRHQPTLHKAATVGRHHQAVRGTRGRVVSQSDSLYSMSSTGSAGSSLSGYSHYSKTSSISSSGPCSPASAAASGSHHLAPPSPATHHHPHHHHHRDPHHASTSPTPSGSSGSSLSPRDNGSHSHHGGCPSGCSGAVPRKPLHTLSNCLTSTSASSSSGSGSSGGSGSSNGSGTMTPMHTYPGRRHVKNRLLDIQNRLPPIKELRSPAKVPHPSPVHVSNPRFRYASYTKSSTHELAPLLREGASPPPPRRPSPMNIQLSCTTLAPPPLKAGGAKICPVTPKNALPKSAYVMPKEKKIEKPQAAGGCKGAGAAGPSKATIQGSGSTSKTGTSSGEGKGPGSSSGSGSGTSASSNPKPVSSSSSNRSFPLFSAGSNQRERADNKKNESVERKKKEEKLKLKAEKEARKVSAEEKRLAKEEERLAKLHAKEEKKRGKKEAKELLLANDIKK
ncbi:midnolin homolog isoform X1 [Drosophila persimilis]|uniref:midnolin homolog isoform X1 n=1 Tax=Drosophila persimilis TaxID=7234 RepID=UPI000F08F50D|nr:midnolin homolog isoform X1 [Drosophila persimilis]